MPSVDVEKLSRYGDWRILIYGQQGRGKTSIAANLSGKTYVLAFSKSYKVLAGKIAGAWQVNARTPIEDLEEWTRSFDPFQYDNLVLDDISNFSNIWLQERGRESKNGISNEIQHFGQWKNYFLRFIEWIFDMPLNVYVTAWESTTSIILPSGQQFNQFSPDLRDSVRNVVMGLCDVVGRLIVKAEDGSRYIVLEGDNSMYAKNRLDHRKICKVEDLFAFEGEDSV